MTREVLRLKNGRWLGIDPGERVFGIALLSFDHRDIQPIKNIRVQDRERAFREILKFIDDYHVVGCVVGLPFTDGKWTRATEKLFSIIRWYMKRIPKVEWRFVDETLTSATIESHGTGTGKRIDMFSACHILAKAIDPDEVLYRYEDIIQRRRIFLESYS